MAEAQSGCGCEPPDTDGDVGPNHYVEAVNSSFKVFDKNGQPCSARTTYNSLFAPLTGTPCSNQNDGDPFVFYDHLADRWVISDFAFPGFPAMGRSINALLCPRPATPSAAAGSSMRCNMMPRNPNGSAITRRSALWNNPQPGGAYHPDGQLV